MLGNTLRPPCDLDVLRLKFWIFIVFQILFVDNKSPSYAKNTSQCEFFIKPFNNTNWGLLESPRHSLPPNTSCKYHFQGLSHQTVWLSFIKYHAASTDPNAYDLSNECNARLRILDKVMSSNTKKVFLYYYKIAMSTGVKHVRFDQGSKP